MFKIHVDRHIQAALNSMGQFSRAPITSLMICLIIGITLALPTALFIMLKNAEHVSGNFQQTTQLTLYLKKPVSQAHANELARKLQNKTGIEKAYTISPEQALGELQQQAGFQGVIDQLNDNPLPWTVVVVPKPVYETSELLDKLSNQLKQQPEVDNIQVDMLWVKRFGTFIVIANRLVFSLTILLGMAVLLIVNNSIRSATQNNQKEIEVLQLIGGTNSFIRRPFLYAGMLYGLLGGIIAWLLVDTLLFILHGPARHLAILYNNQFEMLGLGVGETLSLLIFSASLGFIGSWLAVTRHLHRSW